MPFPTYLPIVYHSTNNKETSNKELNIETEKLDTDLDNTIQEFDIEEIQDNDSIKDEDEDEDEDEGEGEDSESDVELEDSDEADNTDEDIEFENNSDESTDSEEDNNDIQNINLVDLLPSSFGNPSPGVVTLSWTSNSDLVNGATIPDGTTIFEICFDAIGSEGVYPIDFSNTPTSIEIIDALTTSAIDPVNLVSGSVEIEEDNGGGGSGDFTLDISEVVVMQGEEACVEVVASNFENICSI